MGLDDVLMSLSTPDMSSMPVELFFGRRGMLHMMKSDAIEVLSNMWTLNVPEDPDVMKSDDPELAHEHYKGQAASSLGAMLLDPLAASFLMETAFVKEEMSNVLDVEVKEKGLVSEDDVRKILGPHFHMTWFANLEYILDYGDSYSLNGHYSLITILAVALRFYHAVAFKMICAMFRIYYLWHNPDTDKIPEEAIDSVVIRCYILWAATIPKHSIISKRVANKEELLKLYQYSTVSARLRKAIVKKRQESFLISWRDEKRRTRFNLNVFINGTAAFHKLDECCICCDTAATVKYLPCNHVVTCHECSLTWSGTCPLCQGEIVKRQNTWKQLVLEGKGEDCKAKQKADAKGKKILRVGMKKRAFRRYR